MEEKDTKQLSISEISPGMITAQDIYSRTDQLIINKGTVLGGDSLAKLVYYSIGGILVYSQPEAEVEEDVYTSVLKKSADFTNFQEKYVATISRVKKLLERIAHGDKELAKEEQEKAYEDICSLISETGSNVHIFNMLHCSRDNDDAVYIHSVNAALMCNIFSDWLRLEEEQKKQLTICGLLHDVGKLSIPVEILYKPSKLTEEEYAVVMKHSESGYDLLKKAGLEEEILQAVLHHHERYDGTGYPDALSGEQIDLLSCITGIADVYDAMASRRLYRGAICPFGILRVFGEVGMRQFDPQYLQPLLQKVAETYIHHTVQLSDGSKGEVIMINAASPASPVVKVDNTFIDLAKQKELKIDAVL